MCVRGKVGGCYGDEVVKFLHVEQKSESVMVFWRAETTKLWSANIENKLRRERWSGD